MLTYAPSVRMLTYAGVCLRSALSDLDRLLLIYTRMLTYADVCPLSAYADVCWRMPPQRPQ